jgi:queuine tRNA-ribosyltransferase
VKTLGKGRLNNMGANMSETISGGEHPALQLPHGRLQLPVFLPDATRGVVRALDAQDLLSCGLQALQMNVFHLMQRPGSSTIKSLGGLHKLFGWDLPIVTDSGGFQIYSLIRQNPRMGRLSERGMILRPEGSTHRINLTPEKSIQLQMSYGADVLICLDDCTDADEPLAEQQEAVERTLQWARRCKSEYERQVEQRQLAAGSRPLLFAVVQGGADRELRRRCAEQLLEIGFDGFGLGGWPLDSEGKLLTEVIAYTRELIPAEFPMHALGVGQPANLVTCARMGYGLFDSTMPTRDARRGRLYAFTKDPATNSLQDSWYAYLYIQDSKHIRADRPVSTYCDCVSCSRYSLAYLHHLFKIEDPLFFRLATLHNLRFMVQLIQRLRQLQPGSERASASPVVS